MGIALWLQPNSSDEIFQVFSSIIYSAAREVMVTSTSPVFEPHITITSGIILPDEAALKTQAINKILDQALACVLSKPVSIHLSEADSNGLKFGGSYFKAAYYDVKLTEQLAGLAYETRLSFVVNPGSAAPDIEQSKKAAWWLCESFKPHISVLYSNEDLSKEAQNAIRELSAKVNNDCNSWSQGRLTLVRCEGPVESWQVLGSREIGLDN